MTILGIIPARGGSKGIPRKNIKPLLGRPLIAWTIETAQKSATLDRFLVSTEDAEIADTARAFGAEVLDRPPELAGDKVISRDVIRHVLEATGAEVSVLLQPTSPVRDDDLIDRCARAFLKGDYDSMSTGYMNPVYPPHGQEHRRQDISDVFVNDGSVVISTRQTIMAGSLFGRKAGTMLTDPEQNVDVDTDFDFWLAEQVLKKRRDQDPGHRRLERDRLSRERHLMGIHFIQALLEEGDEVLARRVAERAFRNYASEAWGKIFDGLDQAGREKRFRDIMKDVSQSNPDIDISSQGDNHIETPTRACGAEAVYREYGLSAYFQLFCDQDFKIGHTIGPNGALKRPAALPVGDKNCRHIGEFNQV